MFLYIYVMYMPVYICYTVYMKKTYLVEPDKLYERSVDSAVSSLLALISREYITACLSTPPVYIRKAHHNTSGLAVSELMRFIHYITYVVPATPRAINWARPLIQNHQSCTCNVYIQQHSIVVYSVHAKY